MEEHALPVGVVQNLIFRSGGSIASYHSLARRNTAAFHGQAGNDEFHVAFRVEGIERSLTLVLQLHVHTSKQSISHARALPLSL